MAAKALSTRMETDLHLFKPADLDLILEEIDQVRDLVGRLQDELAT
jgi:hypothetical protein